MDIFIARQPILNDKREVIAYELLYRGKSLTMDEVDGNAATLNVINNTFMNIGFEDVIDKGKAFLNFTSDLIKQEIPVMFNRD
ncbi:MAG: histidine kinase, partial [Bacillota bacterium]|nr:histidine kinase [Bacillota bacterium]